MPGKISNFSKIKNSSWSWTALMRREAFKSFFCIKALFNCSLLPYRNQHMNKCLYICRITLGRSSGGPTSENSEYQKPFSCFQLKLYAMFAPVGSKWFYLCTRSTKIRQFVTVKNTGVKCKLLDNLYRSCSHQFAQPLIQLRVVGVLEPIPATVGWQTVYMLDYLPVHCIAFK